MTDQPVQVHVQLTRAEVRHIAQTVMRNSLRTICPLIFILACPLFLGFFACFSFSEDPAKYVKCQTNLHMFTGFIMLLYYFVACAIAFSDHQNTTASP